MKYGPQTAEIEVLIERAKSLTPEQAEELSAVADTARGFARSVARNASWNAVRDASLGTVWGVVWDAARGSVRGSVRSSVWDTVWAAVWDAALALLVKDLISPKHFNILYGPWASAMEKTHP